MYTFEIWTDGHNAYDASSTVGAWIIRRDGKDFDSGSARGPEGWSDVAEAYGILLASQRLKALNISNVSIVWRGDSKFIMKLLNKNKEVHGKQDEETRCYIGYFNQAIRILREQHIKVKAVWIPRELNQEADSLSKCIEITNKGSKFPKQAVERLSRIKASFSEAWKSKLNVKVEK